MNSAVAVFVVAAMAMANAGYLGAPAVGIAPVGLAYSSGIVHGAPLLAHPGLAHVRVGRGIVGASAYGVAPVGLAYNSGIVRSAPILAHPGVAHVRVGRGILGAPVLGA
ncbi:unnamed protein product, partial [Allacma fusca]